MNVLWLLMVAGCVFLFLAMCAADGEKKVLWGLGLFFLVIVTWKCGVAWGI